MDFIRKLVGLAPARVPILKCIIRFDTSNNCGVDFEPLHQNLRSHEMVHLILHYYARILGVSEPQQPQSFYGFLFNATKKISEADLASLRKDVLRLADIDDTVKIQKPTGTVHTYQIVLFADKLGPQRHITLDMPSRGFEQQMVFSLPVLIHEVLKHLGDKEISILQGALKYMNNQFAIGFDFYNINGAAFKNIVKSMQITHDAFFASV